MAEEGPAKLWYRVEPAIGEGDQLETLGGLGKEWQDDRVVEFARASGDLLMPTYTTSYSPLDDPEVLSEFVATFAESVPPTDEGVVHFYRRFGPLRDEGWQHDFSNQDRSELPRMTQARLREPVWWVRELATELAFCCHLYWGLADSRVDVLRDVLGPAPSSGQLVQIMMLGGTLHKVWASPGDRERRVGSFGEWEPSDQDGGREFTPDECFSYARSLLSGHLNQYERQAHRQWVPRTELPATSPVRRRGKKPKPRPENAILSGYRSVVFDTLIGALYLKLSDAVAEGRLLRRCQACQRFFFPDRPDQQYCKTRCSNVYRRRQFSARQRTKSEQADESDAG